MTRYHVYAEPGDNRVRLQIRAYTIFVDNPRGDCGNPAEVTEHHVNAVLEEIVRQSGMDGLRVCDGQIQIFAKFSHRSSGTPVMGMPGRRDVENAFVQVGYRKNR